MSMYRFSQIFLFLSLLAALTALYFVKKSSCDRIKKLSSYQIKEETFLIKSPYGFPALSLDASPNTDFTEALPSLLKTLLPDEGHVLHVGAKSGIHTLYMALNHPKIHITALEGQPKEYDLLKQNIKLLHLMDRVKTEYFNASLTENEIKVCLDAEIPTQKPDTSSQKMEQTMQGKNCHTIHNKAIDKTAWPKINYVVIESHLEANKALLGMENTLKKNGYPPVLLFPNVTFGQQIKDQLKQLMHEGAYMVYKIAQTANKRSFSVSQIEMDEAQMNEPCFILLTKELMPILI